MKVALKNTTSLMIMDEIGQGTSTSDGYSIASAVARALMKSNTAITLYTTHFHDLHENLASYDALRFHSCHMSSEINEKTRDVVRHNYKLCDGAAPFGSCGLSVAKLAGLGDAILKIADVLLKSYESGRRACSEPIKTYERRHFIKRSGERVETAPSRSWRKWRTHRE